MTPQEAIEIITNAIQTDNMTAEQDKGLAIVQKATEKQIPKKVITHAVQKNCKIGARIIQAGTQIDKCPICESFISKINKYCSTCGQALDWG